MPETLTAAYTARELPPEEWYRLDSLGLAQNLPDPETSAILVVERDGVIVGTWIALLTMHLEGCAIAPAHRKSPGAVRALIAGMNDLLVAHGIAQVLTVTQTPEIAQLAEHLGGQPLGQLWLLPVPMGGL